MSSAGLGRWYENCGYNEKKDAELFKSECFHFSNPQLESHACHSAWVIVTRKSDLPIRFAPASKSPRPIRPLFGLIREASIMAVRSAEIVYCYSIRNTKNLKHNLR